MKPDRVSMDTSNTTEPTEAAAVAETSVSHNKAIEQSACLPEQTQNDVSETNGEPDPQAVASKKAAAETTQASSRSKSQPRSAAANIPVNNTQSSANNESSGDKTAAKPSAVGPASKRPVSVATVVPTVKTPTRVVQRRPMRPGPSQTTSSATATTTNATRPSNLAAGRNKRTAADNVDAAQVKSSVAASRPPTSTAQKYMFVAAKVHSGAIPKTGSRPATAPLRPRCATAYRASSTAATRAPTSAPAASARPSASAAAASTGPSSRPSTSRPSNNVASRPPVNASSKASAFRVTTVPSTGRTTASQPQAAAAKKDVSRPPSAAVSKRPAAAKKPEPSKPTATGKATPTSKWATMPKKVDPKGSQAKSQQPAKPGPAKNLSVASPKNPAASKAPQGRNSHASLPNKSTNGSTALAKHEKTKPTQTVLPFTLGVKKMKNSKCNLSGMSLRAADVEVKDQLKTVPQELIPVPIATSEASVVPSQASTQDSPPEAVPQVTTPSHSAPSSPLSSVLATILPEMPLPQQQSEDDASPAQQEQVSTPVELPSPEVASLPAIPSQSINESADQTPTISKAITTAVKSATQVAPPINLNDEEEGSQLVSVSEMSGTTQPTEESRPGSAGLGGGSAWRAGGAFASELDSLSGSQQGASELSAPGVLEGTESMDDLGEGSLKGAMDMEGASAGSPDFQKIPEIPFNDYEEEEEEDDDDGDRVCDMDVGSEKTDELLRRGHDNAVNDEEEEDEDVEMASEAVTESGLESYGNPDEDDFAEDERLDNLNRLAQLPPPPQLPSAPSAQWYQPNPFSEPWEEEFQAPRLQQLPELLTQPTPVEAAVSPLLEPQEVDLKTPSQPPVQAYLEIGPDPHVPENQDVSLSSTLEDGAKMCAEHCVVAPPQTPDMTSFPISTPEELGQGKPQSQEVPMSSPQPDFGVLMVSRDQDVKTLSMPADEVLRGVVNALASNPSSSSVTEDEASDTEGEALLNDSLATSGNSTFEVQTPAQRCLSTVEEAEESETTGLTDDATPPSATSLASYGFDSATTASNAQSTGEGCIKSPGIFSLEELPEESKELGDRARSDFAEQQYIECGKREAGCTEVQESEVQETEEKPEDAHLLDSSTVCEKTDYSFAGLTLPHPDRCRYVDPPSAAPRLTCADLPPRKAGQQTLSPQLQRLEQHRRQLMEMQQRREQQSRPLEGAEQERKRTEEEEQRKKKDEAEEEIKRNEREEETDKIADNGEGKMFAEEEATRHELELQLLQQQSELKQRQQILQWQQELEEQQAPHRAVVLSPSSGLCTIYEALENGDEEADRDSCKRRLAPDLKDPNQTPSNGGQSSPERPAPLDLDWDAKVDMVQQLINQTLLLNGDGCSSLLLLPGGAGGTLSPLESSLWPSLLPPISPPSATVTSVSSFSPEAAGSSPQGEWTVVELETHH